MDWNYLLQQLINGLVVGSMYALVALGYTMVYGIISLINFAHGEVLMFGALIAYSVMLALGGSMPPWALLCVATVVACVGAAALNFAIEKLAYRPLRKRNSPRLSVLIAAIGVSLLLQVLAMIIWKPTPKPYPSIIPSDPIELPVIGGSDMVAAVINTRQIVIMIVTALLMVALVWLVNYTRLGRAMRATAENPRVAELMGVQPDKVISATFIIGAVLAAVAGIMWGMNYGKGEHTMGFLPGLKAFTAAVLGGIGNLPGAVVGGLLIGVVEAIAGGYLGYWTGDVLGSHYAEIFPFMVLILVLTLRPSGLLGERVADRA